RYYEKGCVVNAVITRDNLNIEKIIDSFLEENISNKLSITIATDQHPLNEEEMGIVIDGEQAVINNILHGKYRPSFIYMPLSRFIAALIKRIHKQNRCYAGVDMVAVDVSGKIYPCHRFISISEFVIGDIARGVFCDTYSSYCMNSVDLNDACIHCWARYLCGGPCMHDSYVCHRDTMAVSEYRCKRIKCLIESAIIIYGELIEKNKQVLINMVNL
ncbi:MAG: SPASM domain-containing protein, partial [Chlorobiales bacterium]|nr:SPASM domain-containing protein [Chlorobiales bacterium]